MPIGNLTTQKEPSDIASRGIFVVGLFIAILGFVGMGIAFLIETFDSGWCVTPSICRNSAFLSYFYFSSFFIFILNSFFFIFSLTNLLTPMGNKKKAINFNKISFSFLVIYAVTNLLFRLSLG